MSIALVGVAASRISFRTAGHVVLVICNMPRGVMVTERHADAGANRRHALYGNSEGNHQQEKKTLDLDHGAAESYHGPETSIRYRLFPDSVRPAEFRAESVAYHTPLPRRKTTKRRDAAGDAPGRPA